MRGVDRAGGGSRGGGGEQGGARDAEAHLLALHGRAGRGGGAAGGGVLGQGQQHEAHGEQRAHGRQHRVALLGAAQHRAQRAQQAERDQQHQHDFGEVRDRARVLKGVRGVRVEEPAAVGAQQLDGFLGGYRPARDRLQLPGQGVHRQRVVEILDDTARQQRQRGQHRQRKEQADDAAGQIDPEVAQGAARLGCEPADQSDDDAQAHRGGDEVLHGQACHLCRVAQGAFPGVRLPVGVGDEGGGGVERQRRVHRVHAQRGG